MHARDKIIDAIRSLGLLAAMVVLMLAGGRSIASADEPIAGHSQEPIVGFWQATWKDATTKDVVLHVWDVWHSDRTETQNDSGNTISGNVCQGAWVPLGNRTFGLTHPAYAFVYGPNAPEDQEGNFVDSFSCVILERVRVNNNGDKFSGTGQIKCVSGIDPLDPTAPVNFTENLTITAKRVTVDVNQLPPP